MADGGEGQKSEGKQASASAPPEETAAGATVKAATDVDWKEFLDRHLQLSASLNDRHVLYTMGELLALVERALPLFRDGPMLEKINPPLVVVGDIHGQFFDLLRVFSISSSKKSHGALSTKYVFLGDYVDRGRRSLECLCTVLVLKCTYPEKFVLLRGNHECRAINKVYGFYDEVFGRFPKADRADILKVWLAFNELFSYMPLAVMIGKKILCMHGGIPAPIEGKTLIEAIEEIERPLEDPNTNPTAMALLWADPMTDTKGFIENKIRGVSHYFGEDVVHALCDKENIKLIIRAHQMMLSGYGFFASRKLVTVFTAPRYQDGQNNSGAVMLISEKGKIGFKVMHALSAKERGDKEADSEKEEANANCPYPGTKAAEAVTGAAAAAMKAAAKGKK